MLLFSPKQGLLKIFAIGDDISTNDFGSEVRDAFATIQNAVSKTYGQPEVFDHLKAGSIWGEPRDWSMGLLKKERTLAAYWNQKSNTPNHINLVGLTAVGLTTQSGYIRLSYEFEGFEAYADSKSAREATVF
jgi:hypothetical protein